MTTDVTLTGSSRENDKLALTDLSDMTTEEIARHTSSKFGYGNARSWRNNTCYYSPQAVDGDFMGIKNNQSGVIVMYTMDRYGRAGTTVYNLDGTCSIGLSFQTNASGYDWDKFINAVTTHDPVQKNWDIVQLRVLDTVKPIFDNLYMTDGNNYVIQQNLNEVFEAVHVLQKGIDSWPDKVTRTENNKPIVMDNKIEEMII